MEKAVNYQYLPQITSPNMYKYTCFEVFFFQQNISNLMHNVVTVGVFFLYIFRRNIRIIGYQWIRFQLCLWYQWKLCKRPLALVFSVYYFQPKDKPFVECRKHLWMRGGRAWQTKFPYWCSEELRSASNGIQVSHNCQRWINRHCDARLMIGLIKLGHNNGCQIVRSENSGYGEWRWQRFIVRCKNQ